MSINFKAFLLGVVLIIVTVWLMTGCATTNPAESKKFPGIIAIIAWSGCNNVYGGAVLVDKAGNVLSLNAKQLPLESAKAIGDSLPDNHVEIARVCSDEQETKLWR